MAFHITVTGENIRTFPLHAHDVWEFMCYSQGKGFLHTEEGDYEFSAGTVIAIPPGLQHGSVSKEAFVNICIHVDVRMYRRQIYYIECASSQERELFEMIRSLHFSDNRYENVIWNLIAALKELIEVSYSWEPQNAEMGHVHEEISKHFREKDFDWKALIEKYYVEDYGRSVFQKVYGVTPKAWMNQLRMEYAASLIRTYKKNLKLGEISEECGFSDPLYFSRRFKCYYGISPRDYLKKILAEEKTPIKEPST